MQADGYGFVRFSQALSGSGATTLTISMPTNRASTSKAATAAGDGTNHVHLIDDTEQTNWDQRPNGVAVNTVNPQVTVNLQGTAPVTINRVQVSAMLEPGQNRFTALRQFKIQTSTNGVTFRDWIPLHDAGNAFPGFNPRPVAPEIILRSFSGPSRPATHVRIIVLNNQCTGNPSFQGDQDADPLNGTDCRAGSPGAGPVPVFGDLPQVVAPRHARCTSRSCRSSRAPAAPVVAAGLRLRPRQGHRRHLRHHTAAATTARRTTTSSSSALSLPLLGARSSTRSRTATVTATTMTTARSKIAFRTT